MVWKFCGKAQFPHSFGWFTQNCEETVPFHKISTPWNKMKLRYFTQWMVPPKLRFAVSKKPLWRFSWCIVSRMIMLGFFSCREIPKTCDWYIQKRITVSRRDLGSAELWKFLTANKKLKIFLLKKLDSNSDKNWFDSLECLQTTNSTNLSRVRFSRSHLP